MSAKKYQRDRPAVQDFNLSDLSCPVEQARWSLDKYGSRISLDRISIVPESSIEIASEDLLVLSIHYHCWQCLLSKAGCIHWNNTLKQVSSWCFTHQIPLSKELSLKESFELLRGNSHPDCSSLLFLSLIKAKKVRRRGKSRSTNPSSWWCNHRPWILRWI